jgi:hypothetical protein
MGKEFADATIWLTIAMSLSVFNISKARDEAGNEIIPEIKFGNDIITYVLVKIHLSIVELTFTTELSSCSEKFPCSITVRSDRGALVINSVEAEHPYEPSDAKELAAVPWSPST